MRRAMTRLAAAVTVVMLMVSVVAVSQTTADANDSFADDDGSAHEWAIEAIADAGITDGCGVAAFCPEDAVTREQMATLLVRAFNLTATRPSGFRDIAESPHAADIEMLAAAGVTMGCEVDAYCPSRAVTRAELATFLSRSIGLRPISWRNTFVDDDGLVHEGDIEALAADGVTQGCGANTFCPGEAVKRGEMASLLARALRLPGATAQSDPTSTTTSTSIVASPAPSSETTTTTAAPTTTTTAAPTTTTTAAPTTTTTAAPTTTTTAAPTTTTTAAPTTTTTSPVPRSSGWPTPATTGSRIPISDLTPTSSITTSFDGQVIEGLDVTGQIVVIHDNVTIRDTRIRYSNYGIYLPKKPNGVCTTGTVIEYVELDGSLSPDQTAPAYDSGCEWSLNAVYLHNAGSAIRTYGNTVITNSYLVNDKYGPSGAHREPVLVRGSNHVIRSNVLICDVPQGGCSAALAVYGYPYPTTNVLVEGNWLAATAAYCAYGGATHTYADQAANVDYFNNAFSIGLTPETAVCGRAGNITAHDAGVRDNERSGNYIYETGEPVD